MGRIARSERGNGERGIWFAVVAVNGGTARVEHSAGPRAEGRAFGTGPYNFRARRNSKTWSIRGPTAAPAGLPIPALVSSDT